MQSSASVFGSLNVLSTTAQREVPEGEFSSRTQYKHWSFELALSAAIDLLEAGSAKGSQLPVRETVTMRKLQLVINDYSLLVLP